MRIRSYLSCFAILVLIVNYSCRKPKEDDTGPAGPPMLSVNRTVVNLGNDAGYSDTVGVVTNVDCNLSLSADASWLKVEFVTNTQGVMVGVKLIVTQTSTGPTQRTTLTITPFDTTVAPRRIMITQNAFTLQWQKCYGGSRDDICPATVQLPNGELVTTGSSASADGDAQGNSIYPKPWILGIGQNTNKVWQRALGNNGDYYQSIVATTDGGTVSIGSAYVGNRYSISATRLDAKGNVLWDKTYGGSEDEYGYKIINTADGGYLVSGSTYSKDGDIKAHHGSYDLWVFKLDDNGSIVWEKTFGGDGYEGYGTMAANSDGGFFLAGSSDSNNSGDVPAGHGRHDMFVIKMDANGNKLWSKVYGGTGDEMALAIIGDPNGGCALTGYTTSSDGDVTGYHGNYNGMYDMWVLQLNNNGALVWQTVLGGTSDDYGYGLVRLTNGNTVVTGRTNSINGDVTGNHGNQDAWVVELTSTGRLKRAQTFGSTGYDRAHGVIVVADGSLLVTAIAGDNNGDVIGNHGGADVWLFKLKID
jgi:hypothetical protein